MMRVSVPIGDGGFSHSTQEAAARQVRVASSLRIEERTNRLIHSVSLFSKCPLWQRENIKTLQTLYDASRSKPFHRRTGVEHNWGEDHERTRQVF